MWDEYKNLTPEERLDKIVEILTDGVLRIIEEKKRKGTLRHSSSPNNFRRKQPKPESKILSESP